MDKTSIIGLVVGIAGILIGYKLEDGHLVDLLQMTAGIIVLGGTIGAVVIGSTLQDLKQGIGLLFQAFSADPVEERRVLAKGIVDMAVLARQESILAIEKRVAQMPHPLMRDVFRCIVDGVDPENLQDIFDEKIDINEQKKLAGAKIWTDAGGYAPTVGIIGAVLGLIHVMQNITNTSALGQGIAVAFVATIYGVGFANLICLPLGSKIKRKIHYSVQTERMIVEGATAIIRGLNPYMIREKMNSYTGHGEAEVGA